MTRLIESEYFAWNLLAILFRDRYQHIRKGESPDLVSNDRYVEVTSAMSFNANKAISLFIKLKQARTKEQYDKVYFDLINTGAKIKDMDHIDVSNCWSDEGTIISKDDPVLLYNSIAKKVKLYPTYLQDKPCDLYIRTMSEFESNIDEILDNILTINNNTFHYIYIRTTKNNLICVNADEKNYEIISFDGICDMLNKRTKRSMDLVWWKTINITSK